MAGDPAPPNPSGQLGPGLANGVEVPSPARQFVLNVPQQARTLGQAALGGRLGRQGPTPRATCHVAFLTSRRFKQSAGHRYFLTAHGLTRPPGREYWRDTHTRHCLPIDTCAAKVTSLAYPPQEALMPSRLVGRRRIARPVHPKYDLYDIDARGGPTLPRKSPEPPRRRPDLCAKAVGR